MTTYLIAHKVRGQPAFDIAERMECGLCANADLFDGEVTDRGCDECDNQGFWWIIPTSGHRAYPWRSLPLTELEGDVGRGFFEAIKHEMPSELPDHYPTVIHREPKQRNAVGLLDILGLNKPRQVVRRRV